MKYAPLAPLAALVDMCSLVLLSAHVSAWCQLCAALVVPGGQAWVICSALRWRSVLSGGMTVVSGLSDAARVTGSLMCVGCSFHVVWLSKWSCLKLGLAL